MQALTRNKCCAVLPLSWSLGFDPPTRDWWKDEPVTGSALQSPQYCQWGPKPSLYVPVLYLQTTGFDLGNTELIYTRYTSTEIATWWSEIVNSCGPKWWMLLRYSVLSHTLILLLLQVVIVQRLQAELSQQVSSLQNEGQVSQVALIHAYAAWYTPAPIYK